MAVTLAENDIWEVRFVCYATDLTQVAVNVRHYHIGGTNPAARTDETLAEFLSDAFAPLYKAVLSPKAQFRGVSVQRAYPKPRTRPFVNVDGFGQGTFSAMGVDPEILPGQVSGLIGLQTANAGPAYRGRVYVPFPDEVANTDQGKPSSQYWDIDLRDLAVEFRNQQLIGVGDAAVASPVLFRYSVEELEGPLWIRIDNAIPREEWATQRRRGGYGKINKVPF